MDNGRDQGMLSHEMSIQWHGYSNAIWLCLGEIKRGLSGIEVKGR